MFKTVAKDKRFYMSQRKKTSITRVILDCLLVLPNFINLMSNLFIVLKLEIKLFKRSLVSMITLGILLLFFLFSTWFCLLGLLVAYLVTSLQWTVMFSLFILLLIHIGFILIFAIILSQLKKNIFFPETRAKCRELSRICRKF